MTKRWMVVLAMSAIALTVPAEGAFKGCYERVYDGKYLRKHKTQDVTKMRFQIGVSQGADGPFEYLDRIDAGFRKGGRYRGNLVECKEEGGGLACAIEADGGTFTVIDRGKDKGRQAIRISNGGEMRFGDEEDGITIRAKGDNREFRLYRVSEGPCP